MLVIKLNEMLLYRKGTNSKGKHNTMSCFKMCHSFDYFRTAKAKGIKVYSAFKSSGTKPYSVLRLSGDDHTRDKETLIPATLDDIIREEILLDEDIKNLGLNLTEDIVRLDEFALLRSVFGKLKGIGKDVTKWLTDFFKKVGQKVKGAIKGIMKLGEKMFEGLFQFLGIEITKVTTTVPSELADFVNK